MTYVLARRVRPGEHTLSSNSHKKANWPRVLLQACRLQYDAMEVPQKMSLVRLLGFTTLMCGCVSGRYREVGTDREITYIEEKGTSCGHTGHQRNQPVSANRVAHGFVATDALRVS